MPDTPPLWVDGLTRSYGRLVGLDKLDLTLKAGECVALIDQLGLTERADFLPTELSRGLRQKTGLACALIRPSRVLMLDEPVVGLDPPSQALLRQLLLDAKAEGKAILLTTHQMRFADGIADRAIVLGDGTVLDRGRWKDVRGRAADRGWLPEDA